MSKQNVKSGNKKILIMMIVLLSGVGIGWVLRSFAAGPELWVNRFHENGKSLSGQKIVVSPNGQMIFVLGTDKTDERSVLTGINTINGKRIWTQKFGDLPTELLEVPLQDDPLNTLTDIDVSDKGDVVYTADISGGSRLDLRAYNALTGVKIWENLQNRTGHDHPWRPKLLRTPDGKYLFVIMDFYVDSKVTDCVIYAFDAVTGENVLSKPLTPFKHFNAWCRAPLAKVTIPLDAAISSDGASIYITGLVETERQSGFKHFIMRMPTEYIIDNNKRSGVFWTKTLGENGSVLKDTKPKIVLGIDRIFVASSTTRNIALGSNSPKNVLALSYDLAGSLKWAKTHASDTNNTHAFISADQSSVYLGATVGGKMNAHAYDYDGNQKWSRDIQTYGAGGLVTSGVLSLDKSTLFVTGKTFSNTNSYDYFTAMLNPADGNDKNNHINGYYYGQNTNDTAYDIVSGFCGDAPTRYCFYVTGQSGDDLVTLGYRQL